MSACRKRLIQRKKKSNAQIEHEIENNKSKSLEPKKKINQMVRNVLKKKNLQIRVSDSTRLLMMIKMRLKKKLEEKKNQKTIRHQTTLQKSLKASEPEKSFLHVPLQKKGKKKLSIDLRNNSENSLDSSSFSCPSESVLFEGIQFVFEGKLEEKKVEEHKYLFQTRERTYLDMLKATAKSRELRLENDSQLHLSSYELANLGRNPYVLTNFSKSKFGRFAIWYSLGRGANEAATSESSGPKCSSRFAP